MSCDELSTAFGFTLFLYGVPAFFGFLLTFNSVCLSIQLSKSPYPEIRKSNWIGIVLSIVFASLFIWGVVEINEAYTLWADAINSGRCA